MEFTLLKEDSSSKARLGKLKTAHSEFETPIFMPVGTRAAVKTLTSKQLHALEAQIILGNTYHLMLKPGAEIIEKAGGLHKFMNWDKSILTDSGGFQVFSLSSLNRVTDQGVHFQSHIDGSSHFLGPRESMAIQKSLGSDIVMAFDECPPYPCSRIQLEESLVRTEKWARVCRDYTLHPNQNLFGIVQGGIEADLRRESAKSLVSMDFDGYAIGGVSVGEPEELMYQAVEASIPFLPKEKPRYLMGVGTPKNMIEAVMRGIDLFDCVMPTRNARNGMAFTWDGKVQIKAARYKEDFSPLDPHLDNEVSSYSKAYIRHLLNVDEITGLTLVTMQNLSFYLDLMKKIRQAIENNTIDELYKKIVSLYPN
ncbi:tRNA guanosine(34) transglycosylase Tgt [Criblamydia sequanensis]|uniref:Queuine tRNA-ribosyltransferase n=1 Tax=Candidatus Criblamydia sequanensis CRIB-18 TaxID=1437425 RepID=A0A090CXR0_9BACT|nr:tRNA guanosine(34) transglycosylase Tgt [Criblamydia sequanensis]CDR32892.1 Queuine tRNA-ribosyltransferase [Criblamydia sequanensis CRIB-18]